MEKLATIDQPSRWEIYMARRKATKALKFVTTNRVDTWNEFEIEGQL